MKFYLKLIAILLVAFLLYLLLWPVDISPKAWTPPQTPALSGVYQPNEALAKLEMFQVPVSEGPEDLAIDSSGFIYTGLLDGQILRYQPDGSDPEVFAETGGRPLGMAFNPQGNLIVADAEKGILLVDAEGGILPLSTAYKGQAFFFADDLDIGADGKIYFSDACLGAGVRNWKKDIMAHSESGRLFLYDPERQHTQQLLGGLSFANGVALGPDDAYLLVNETSAYRIVKYWLKGPKAGSSEIFIENLPGFPDNISYNGNGIFWVAIANPRNDLLDKILPHPFLRKVIHRLPDAIQPAPVRYGFVLGINEAGEIVHNLQDPSGAFAPVTSVKEIGDFLYLGSLSEHRWARLPSP